MLAVRRRTLADLALVCAGAASYGFGFCTFLLPNGVIVGGASGAAVLISRFVPLPVGLWILFLNLPLLAVSARLDGWRSVIRTAVGTTALSAGTQLGQLLPAFTGDVLLSAAAGGSAMGFGAGLMMLRGYTSGGSDLAGYLICRRHPRLSAGRVILAIDCSVIALSAAVTGSVRMTAYSVVSSAAYAFVLDHTLRGVTDCRLAFIISDKSGELSRRIGTELERGVTAVSGRGEFTGDDHTVLMCAVARREEYVLRRIVVQTDPAAFVIFTSGCEVIGKGFGEK